MTLLLSNEDVLKVLDMLALVNALESAMSDELAGHLVQPPRQNIYLPGGFLRIGAACLPASDLMGFKAFNGSIELGVRYLVNLYRESTGELLTMVDASYLTAARTGATTGVATRHLSRADSTRVAVIGSGLEAWTNLSAVCAVRDITEVVVFSPREQRREAFAQKVTDELRVSCRAAASPEQAVEGADVVVVATNTGKGSGRTAFEAGWLRPGMHVNSIGSTMPDLRELDAAVFTGVDAYVVDTREGVIDESGDVQQAQRDGTYPERVIEIAEVVAGGVPGRTSDQDVTLFKSVGTAMQDVIGAHAVYEAACALELGTRLPDFPAPKFA